VGRKVTSDISFRVFKLNMVTDPASYKIFVDVTLW